MMLVYITLLVNLLYAAPAQGLECIHCSNVMLDRSGLSNSLRLALSKLESTYNESKCSSLALNTCAGDNSKDLVNRCGKLVGTVNVSANHRFIGNFEIPVHIQITGCFLVEYHRGRGCYADRKILGRQRNVISDIFMIIEFLKIGKFNGNLCLNEHNQAHSSNTHEFRNVTITEDSKINSKMELKNSFLTILLCYLTVLHNI